MRKDLIPIKARVTKMTSVVTDLVIKDQAGLENASKILSSIKDVAKKIKQHKDARIKPINDSLKLLRADYKPLEDYCLQAEMTVKKKVLYYNTQMEKDRTEKEKKLEERVESGSLKVETAAKKLEELPDTPGHVKTGKGSMTIKKVKKFRVVDMAKLPIAYHSPNEVMIRQKMYEGVELPGVEYLEEDSVSAS